jgi:aromatic ring-cleaving dioxygenase
VTYLDPVLIENWHAHVYFEPSSRDAAWAFRQEVGARFGEAVQFGNFNERLVGPHPVWSYEISFSVQDYARVTSWLILNHGGLDIFLHPNTEDGLRDHRDSAVWIGRSHVLNLEGFAP